ncbi:hypothetical protein BGZ95_004984 [Linnemannia exigua]|uniref:Uncharacterized protein n=1 Tax=Linnemannia exigua TaxID=604196 RepID=A0AAD4H1E5_9FUNG|nr:hypothetical protein BGZ95_004984 [Linnemannia exigua]
MEQMSIESESLLQEGLVPLEEFRITNFEAVETPEMDNSAVAFNRTLKTIKAYYYGMIAGENYVITRFDTSRTIRNWKRVGHNVREYSYEYLRYCQCQPAHLPKLKFLSLQGLPALSFHPDTFDSTTQLTELSLVGNNYTDDNDDRSYYFDVKLNRYYGIQEESINNSTPPSSAITRRPTWTWEWNLPNLVSLNLTSEFAFLFEFRMLYYCPVLESLELEMRTVTGSHSQTTTTAYMFTPTGITIYVPTLTKLRLHGPWDFSGLHFGMQFLKSMFPRLESLSALG